MRTAIQCYELHLQLLLKVIWKFKLAKNAAAHLFASMSQRDFIDKRRAVAYLILHPASHNGQPVALEYQEGIEAKAFLWFLPTSFDI